MLTRLVTVTCFLGLALAGESPPSFMQQPPQKVDYRPREELELLCIASGNPALTYLWKKNGEVYTPDERRVRMEENSGTLKFSRTSDSDEGYYQCFASNRLGTAVTHIVQMKASYQNTFPESPPSHVTVNVGQTRVFDCTGRPLGYPDAEVGWVTARSGKKSTTHADIVPTLRKNVDYLGRLWITYVLEEDQLEENFIYECKLHNRFLNTISLGAQYKLTVNRPDPGRGDVGETASQVTLLWSSVANTQGLKGGSTRMKCIFSGYPSPNVTWVKVGGRLDPLRHDTSALSELIINNLMYSDQGEYRCVARNARGTSVESSFHLSVEAKPEWTERPRDQVTSEDSDATFKCQASGVPQPDIQWFVNGELIGDAPPNPRRQLDGGDVRFTGLLEEDAQVLQCNASNMHGYVFTNAYLNIRSVPPQFTETDNSPVQTSEGSTRVVKCRSFGIPKPETQWRSKGVQVGTSGRFKVLPVGDLEIRNVELTDAGDLQCTARNKLGSVDHRFTLVVRERTRIVTSPTDSTVTEGDTATFNCGAETDPALQAELTIVWQRDGEALDMSDGKYSTEDGGATLKITPATLNDTATYTCNASNGVDEATAEAALVVQAAPDAPQNVVIRSCQPREARITWEGAIDNNSPILGYIVEYNTSETQWTLEGEVNSYARGSDIALYPGNDYYFRVSARNAIGTSRPTVAKRNTVNYCRTPENRPEVNPKNVSVLDEGQRKLVVAWDPVPRIAYGGKGFQYKVSYRRLDMFDLDYVLVPPGTGDKKVFFNMPIYKPYEVQVTSQNDLGINRNPGNKVIGYSGEDVPTQVVQNFRLDETQEVTDKQATFLMDAVDESAEATNGFFVGYKIEFWKRGKPGEKKIWIEKLRDVADEGKEWKTRYFRRFRRQQPVAGKEISITVKTLPPYSNVEARVMVINKKYTGKPSDLAYVTTDEGVPGPVEKLRVDEIGPKHVTVSWDYPLEPNGEIIGYEVHYAKVVDGHEEPVQKLDDSEWDPTQKTAKVTGLDTDETYNIYVYAKTKKGRGAPMATVVSTSSSGPPGPPQIAINGYTNTAMNVTWVPNKDTKYKPASAFYVQYKLKGAKDWNATEPVSQRLWQNLTNLVPRETYQVRVIATNGPTFKAASKTIDVNLAEPTALGRKVGTPSIGVWFIVLMVILVLLIIALFIVCWVRYNRGQKYRIDDPPERTFEEFKRPEEPPKKKRPSLDSDTKPGVESDTDSLGVYEDDPTKFNEDGSFIGQYGSNQRQSKEDGQAPTAVSTFV